MTRASFHFEGGHDASAGWLADVSVLPSVGDEILLLDVEGNPVERGRVGNVRHLLVTSGEYRAAAHQIEVGVIRG